MKPLFHRSWISLLCLVITSTLSFAAEPFRLLTVGNSFADNATRYLPQIAQAAGREIKIYKANLGGHSLEQHASYLALYLKDSTDPKGRPYPALSGKEKSGLPQALTAEKWDAVTIQQYSLKSADASSYEPFAGQLVAEIRKDAPQAKIYVHQTWAYREDSPRFQTEGNSQAAMYEGLRSAYGELAKRYDLTLIPVGDAFQAARQTDGWKFNFPDPAFDYKNPPADQLPNQAGSLNTGWNWSKQKDGSLQFKLDANHANTAGCYLGACVWFEVLFGASVLDNTFVPEGLTPEQAAQLRQIAHDTVAAMKSGAGN